MMYETVVTADEWIAMQQKMVNESDEVPDNLPIIVKSGNCFVLKWIDDQERMMFLLKWA